MLVFGAFYGRWNGLTRGAVKSMRIKRRSGFGGYGRAPRGRLRIRSLVFLFLVLLVGFFAYRKVLSLGLGRANAAMAEDRLDAAEKGFRRVGKLSLGKTATEDALGAIALLRGDLEAAKRHFRSVLDRKPSGFGGDPSIVLTKLTEAGRYDRGALYAELLKGWKTPEQLAPYSLGLAAVALGNRDLAAARQYLDAANPASRERERFQVLSRLLEEYEAMGFSPVVLDRNGAPILSFRFASGNYELNNPKLFAGWPAIDEPASPFGQLDEVNLLNRIHTSLDLNLQKAAHESMKDYQGTMILLDPSSGDILAAYGTPDHPPFRAAFEPGSVIKVLTYAFFLETGGDAGAYAPKKYPGNTLIGGKLFYDWKTHGQLDSVEQGMSVSCNLMFAQMGIDLGWPKMNQGFRQWFDGASAADLGEAFFGRLVREPENAWDLGRAAIGLDFLETTSLGIAMIPSMIANGGRLFEPRLFQGFSNIEGVQYRTLAPQDAGRLVSENTAALLLASLETPMLAPEGTARRAKVDFVHAAMKTGTAGDRPFDSVMIGLFPVEKPKLVFGFYLDKGGKCEYNGAKVARLLQEQIQALAPQYLE